MQITQVLTIENKNTNSIHLVQDALFFRAYEKSAWLFGKYFKDYKVNCRYYKNIQQELLWLGFSSSISASQQSYVGLLEHHASYSLRKRLLRE